MGLASRSSRLRGLERLGRDRFRSYPASPTSGLGYARFSGIERWFAAMGSPARFDLARSGAPARTVSELLAMACHEDVETYLGMPLDYGEGVGSERLRAAIGAHLGCDEGQVVVTHGAAEALLLACSAVLGERRDVAVATPSYEGLYRAVEAAGGIPRRVRVWDLGSEQIDLSGLAELDLRRYAAVVLNVPHNPTGLCVERPDLEALARRCARFGTALVVDEVSLATLDAGAASSISLAVEDSPVLALGDVSKAYGLGGLRVGWCACKRPDLLSRIAALRDLTTISNSQPSQLLATIALENRGQLCVSELARSNLERLRRVMASLSGVCLVRPSDGLVAFCDLALPARSAPFAEMLRQTSDVSVTPGSFFGCDRYLRIGLGVREEDFSEGLQRLVAALRNDLSEYTSADPQLAIGVGK